MKRRLRALVPVRAWLVWHALRGDAIVYRAAIRNGSLMPETPAFLARLTIVPPPAIVFPAGETHVGTTLDVR